MSKPVEKQEWFQVAEAFEASGLTQKEFSSQRGLKLKLSTLQSWVYRRRQHARKTLAVRLLLVDVSAVTPPSPVQFEVVLASGARLRFPAGADVDNVARLVTALGR
ncbi:hypothetical protein MFUL124B02_05765 [Myxococcus fulvus 124B02]|nr:hypothetical protein MFUL124B02_05765 [Myxococcus fulvus 124B02]